MHKFRYERLKHGRGRVFIDDMPISAYEYTINVGSGRADTVTLSIYVDKVEIVEAQDYMPDGTLVEVTNMDHEASTYVKGRPKDISDPPYGFNPIEQPQPNRGR